MKLNPKILIALVVIVGAAYWAFTSVRSSSYSGTNLTFDVGSGPVTVTNPSESPVPVQLTGASSRRFSVSSTIEGLPSTSIGQGTGSATTQLFEFDLPAGVSEFTVLRGNNVQFIATTPTLLQADVNPSGSEEARSTLIAAAVLIAVGLYYISRTTEHRWIAALRGAQPTVEPVGVAVGGGQGRATRSYGDNRADQ